MKKYILVIFLLLISVVIVPHKNSSILAQEEKMLYTGTIEHAFTHCLIAYPEIAFNKNNPMRASYNRDCITKDEFKSVLINLYNNNFALIDINKTFTTKNGVVIKRKLYMPKGKKPLILSFDDVNYDHKKSNLGMVDKLIIDKKGEIATSTRINGKVQISHDNEFIPILENFIKMHPDFSVDGAKGTINLTGYDGILGYRTQKNSPNREKEIAEVKPVINKLKQNGWTFACHSYGHYHMKKISDEKFEKEISNWNDEVVPLIGKTEIYVYPYGEWEIDKNNQYTSKHKMLLQDGFKLFCGVGMHPFFTYMPYKTKINPPTLFMDRKVIDGFALKERQEDLKTLFNPKNIYDYSSRI